MIDWKRLSRRAGFGVQPSNPRIHSPRLFTVDRVFVCLSLTLSVLAIALTVDSQNLDRFYREASIKPHIVIETDDEDDGIKIRNDGAGVAMIKDLSIVQAGAAKLVVDQSNNVSGKKKQFVHNIRDIVDKQFRFLDVQDADKFLKVNNWYVASIYPGQSKVIFTFDVAKMRAALAEKEGQMDGDRYAEEKSQIDYFLDNFVDSTDISICYYSITDFYCDGTYSYVDARTQCRTRDNHYTPLIRRFLKIFRIRPD